MICCFALFVSHACAQSPAYDFTAVRSQFENNLDLYGLGVSVAVEQRDSSIFTYQSGAVTQQTKLGIASCSKWLSGAVVLILAERGCFDLDDRIGQYIPALDEAGKGDPTIRQCFAMTSGLHLASPDYETDKTLTLAQSVDLIIANTPLIFPPGTQLAYDGDAMQIVGRICEIVTGKSWTNLAGEILFTPLGMTSSSYDLFDGNPGIAGGVRSTAADYLKFLRMLLRNGVAPDGTVIMSSRSVNIFFANQTEGFPEYASPWPDTDYNVYGNRGDYGMGSWILAQPEPGAAVEEVCSPGAFGGFPWIDRKRGLAGMVFTLAIGAAGAQDNTLHALTLMRAEIDTKGMPDPGPSGPLTITGAGAGYLRIDWTGGGVIEASVDLEDWTSFPLMSTPFIENANRLPVSRFFYRVR
jgi:CubicO group peptidase (beta-lactamase class C family)